MEDKGAKDKLGGIVPTDSQTIAKSFAPLTGRGLRLLSGWDAAKIIEAGKQLTSAYNLGQIIGTISGTIREFLPTSSTSKWSLLLLDEKKGELYYVIVPKDDDYYGHHKIKMGNGLIGHVAESRITKVITDVQTNATILAEAQEPQEKRAKSIVAVPLTCGSRCIGVIEIIDCVGPGGLPQADLLLLEAFADFAAIAIAKERYASHLRFEFINNEPRGLYNGRHLDFQLENAFQDREFNEYHFSLVRVVSEELKGLAASLSYAHYTELLDEVGREINGFCYDLSTEMLQRIPPLELKYEAYHNIYDEDVGEELEEFALILLTSSKEDACFVACRFHKFFQKIVWQRKQGLNLRLTASIGVATYPEDGRTKTELLQSAGEAVNLVRNSTGNGVAAAKVGILPPL